jgi:hypothetical protein
MFLVKESLALDFNFTLLVFASTEFQDDFYSENSEYTKGSEMGNVVGKLSVSLGYAF